MGEKPLFQPTQELCFDTILGLYGQDCTWEKEGGDVTGAVLFNDPTKEERFNITGGRGLSHVGYDNAPITKPYIEYREGQFDGLFELVFEQDKNQYIETGGERFVTTLSETFFDGQTYRISLQKAETDTVIEEP